jgi:hypothetical protein
MVVFRRSRKRYDFAAAVDLAGKIVSLFAAGAKLLKTLGVLL